ncbi:glycoside hydrolase family 35 protein [Microbacterium sp. A196]|uniref:glycoside hydrolase family 35 protein n=1 Tax=Microbacterium sp. A196 TaxID=3457320 RepID=UPI003FD50E3D
MNDAFSPASGGESALVWQGGQLIRDGRPHRILAGALHYFRVHPGQWEDRLRRLAAMGANTVDTYVPWNFHERVEGDVRFDGWQDIEAFIRLAGEVGLDVFLRPSPYICAEWSNGGLPVWLTGRVSALRTSDPEFLAAVDRWFDALIPRMVPLQAVNGGPIIAVQVENEYGSFGSDHAYLEHQRDALRSRGIVELLTTADGITSDMVAHGSVGGAMGTFTFGTGVPAAEELLVPGQALMCSELWGGWFDHWGEQHHVRSAASMIGTVDELLAAGGSVSIYMAHGGTNFGLWNGANHFGMIEPTITSYDSDAPIHEDGSLGDKFDALRAAFAPFHDGELSEPPAPNPVQPAQTVRLQQAASLRALVETLPVIGERTPAPQSFEQLGVEDGIVVYQASIDIPAESTITIADLRDRATVFVDDERIGTMEHDGEHALAIPGGARKGALTIVVESLGRINYGPQTGAHKGILGGVLVGGRRFVHGWTHRALPLDAPQAAAGAGASRTERADDADGVAVASIQVETPADSWLAFRGGVKGMVWLNGFLLGRYWDRGPQVTLYAPAPLWKPGANEIVVLDTDALPAMVELRETPEYGAVEEFIGS